MPSSKPRPNEAESTPMLTRLLSLLKLAAAITLALILIDVAIFRSGAYRHVLEPESTAGTTLSAVYAARHLYDPQRKNVVVLGNSQIGEGFSGQLAEASSGRTDLHFINAAIAGSSPRVWDYVLRAADPRTDHFAAVVLMVSYDTFGIQVDPADSPLDVSYLAPLVGFGDVPKFPLSFHAAEQRARAWRAIMLPLQTMREDALALLANPLDRFNKARKYYPGWLGAVQLYGGHPEAVPTLDIDPTTGQPRSWDGVPADLKAHLEGYFAGLRNPGYGTPQLRVEYDAYMREWIGDIALRYQAHGVPVIVFVVPRGPFHALLAPVPVAAGAIAELRDAGLIRMLPGDTFVSFEQPRFFFDTLHMNRAGREAFSAMLAQKIAPLVP